MRVKTITCPNCGHANNFLAEECAQCGINFSRYYEELEKAETLRHHIEEQEKAEALKLEQEEKERREAEIRQQEADEKAEALRRQQEEQARREEEERERLKEEEKRLEAERRREAQKREDILRRQKEALEKAEALRRQEEEQEKAAALKREQEERERLEAEARQKEEKEQAEALHHQREEEERLAREARNREKEKQERREAEIRQREAEAAKSAEADITALHDESGAIEIEELDPADIEEHAGAFDFIEYPVGSTTDDGHPDTPDIIESQPNDYRLAASLEERLRVYEGRMLGLTYGNPAEIQNVKLLAVSKDHFQVFYPISRNVVCFSYGVIVSITENTEGLSAVGPDISPVFPVVVELPRPFFHAL